MRDLTELREHDGRLVSLPTAEDTIATCLDSIRRAQAQRPSDKRFSTNRIVIYVWPPISITREEMEMIARRVLPTSTGAGLEEILFIGRYRDPASGELTKVAVRILERRDRRPAAHHRRTVRRGGRAPRQLPPQGSAGGGAQHRLPVRADVAAR